MKQFMQPVKHQTKPQQVTLKLFLIKWLLNLSAYLHLAAVGRSYNLDI